jgi:hypothetical protein
MNARQFWLGIAVIVVAILAHAAFPRYEWRQVPEFPAAWTRIDRWTGSLQLGAIQPGGVWLPANDPAFQRPKT